MNPNRRAQLEIFGPLAALLLFGLFLDWHIHRYAELREAFSHTLRDMGENMNILCYQWARILKQIPLRLSWFFLIPYSYEVKEGVPQIGLYTSYPAMLASLTTLLDIVFGATPLSIRRMAIVITVLRSWIFYVFMRQLFMKGGPGRATRIGLFALVAYVLLPVNLLSARSVTFEGTASLFLFTAFFLALRGWRWLSLAVFFLAYLTEWPSGLFFPVLMALIWSEGARAAERKKNMWVLGAGIALLALVPYGHYAHFLGGYMVNKALVIKGVWTSTEGGKAWGFLLAHVLNHFSILFDTTGPWSNARFLPRFYHHLGAVFPLLAICGLFLKPPRSLVLLAAGGLAYILLFYMVLSMHDYASLFLLAGVSALAALPLNKVWELSWDEQAGEKWLRRSFFVWVATLYALIHGWALPAFSPEEAAEVLAYKRDAEEMSVKMGRTSYYLWRPWHPGPNPAMSYIQAKPSFVEPYRFLEGKKCVDYGLVFQGWLKNYPEESGATRIRAECPTVAENASFLLVPGTCFCRSAGLSFRHGS